MDVWITFSSIENCEFILCLLLWFVTPSSHFFPPWWFGSFTCYFSSLNSYQRHFNMHSWSDKVRISIFKFFMKKTRTLDTWTVLSTSRLTLSYFSSLSFFFSFEPTNSVLLYVTGVCLEIPTCLPLIFYSLFLHLKPSFWGHFSSCENILYYRKKLTTNIKGQIVNILGFASHFKFPLQIILCYSYYLNK